MSRWKGDRDTEREILILVHIKKISIQTRCSCIWRDSELEQFHFHSGVALLYKPEPLQGEPRAADIHSSTGSFSVNFDLGLKDFSVSKQQM